jgi:hypothetical protein
MFDTKDREWGWYVERAEHLKALEMVSVYLTGNSLPWHLVTAFESGGTHRLGVSVSLSFTAKHSSGLTFRWSFDLEGRGANGESQFKIATSRIRDMLAQLPPHIAEQVRDHLTQIASKVRERADEYSRAAVDQHAAADALIRIGAVVEVV